jgi:hypothetical protein
VIACGPTVTFPLRATVVGLRSTASVTVPERLLLLLAGSAIHAAELETVHAHPVSVSTETTTSPPLAGTVVFAGETV